MTPPKKVMPKAFTIPRTCVYNLRPRITRLRSGMRNIKQGSGMMNRPSTYPRRTHFRRASRNGHSASSKTNNGNSDSIKCAICLDTERSRAMEHIPCGHSFHAKCCEKWLSRSAACPVCRTPVLVLPVLSGSSRNASSRRTQRRRRRHVLIRQQFQDMFLGSASIIIIDLYRFRNVAMS